LWLQPKTHSLWATKLSTLQWQPAHLSRWKYFSALISYLVFRAPVTGDVDAISRCYFSQRHLISRSHRRLLAFLVTHTARGNFGFRVFSHAAVAAMIIVHIAQLTAAYADACRRTWVRAGAAILGHAAFLSVAHVGRRSWLNPLDLHSLAALAFQLVKCQSLLRAGRQIFLQLWLLTTTRATSCSSSFLYISCFPMRDAMGQFGLRGIAFRAAGSQSFALQKWSCRLFGSHINGNRQLRHHVERDRKLINVLLLTGSLKA
jgi:hypothetical protein